MGRIADVVRKYRLDVETDVKSESLGLGPIMEKAALETFLAHDPSGSAKYLEWMIFQAGGGQVLMQKMHDMWNGLGPSDQLAQCPNVKKEYLEEVMRPYFGVDGKQHPPMTREQALCAWPDAERHYYHEFLMGDQDLAVGGGYGFFRHWNERYDRIVEAIKFWHQQLPALKALNEEADITDRVELDIYAKWSFGGFNQPDAVYGTVEKLEEAFHSVRWRRVLLDVRYDTVYEDALLLVVAPLTIGASMKYGVSKWCTSNETNLRHSLNPSYPAESHWTNYLSRGPVVYWCWKIPMPPYLWRLAIHISNENLARCRPQFLADQAFINAFNDPKTTTYAAIREEMLKEHLRMNAPPSDQWPLAFGRKDANRAWDSKKQGKEVVAVFDKSLKAVSNWANGFDTRRIVKRL